MVLFVNTVERLANYSSFHKNPVNIIIHVVCVPAIVFSIVLMGLVSPYENESIKSYTPDWVLLPHLVILAFTLFILVWSVLLEPVAGAIMTLEATGFLYWGRLLYDTYGPEQVFYIGLAIHIISWIFQFVGHGIFEGRRPAFFTGFMQTFSAPVFVVLELLFLVGYRPGLQVSVAKSLPKYLDKPVKKQA